MPPELVLLLSIELDLIVRADPCQARPGATGLVRHGLLDELVLWVHPVLAGVGTPSDMLISDGLNARLTLADVKTLSSGVVILSYRPS